MDWNNLFQFRHAWRQLLGVKLHSTSASLEAGAEHTAFSLPPSNMITDATCTSAVQLKVQLLSKGDKRLLKVKNCLEPQVELKVLRNIDNSSAQNADAQGDNAEVNKVEEQL
jgi:hypothetical protein